MRILLGAAAAAASFSTISASVVPDDFQIQLLTRSIAYRECVAAYAYTHAGPGASPTEIASAADFRCSKQFEEFRNFYQANVIDNFPIDESSEKKKNLTLHAKSYLQGQMNQTLKIVQDAAKSEAAAIVIDVRNK
jgi:hypothetical protein